MIRTGENSGRISELCDGQAAIWSEAVRPESVTSATVGATGAIVFKVKLRLLVHRLELTGTPLGFVRL